MAPISTSNATNETRKEHSIASYCWKDFRWERERESERGGGGERMNLRGIFFIMLRLLYVLFDTYWTMCTFYVICIEMNTLRINDHMKTKIFIRRFKIKRFNCASVMYYIAHMRNKFRWQVADGIHVCVKIPLYISEYSSEYVEQLFVFFSFWFHWKI